MKWVGGLTLFLGIVSLWCLHLSLSLSLALSLSRSLAPLSPLNPYARVSSSASALLPLPQTFFLPLPLSHLTTSHTNTTVTPHSQRSKNNPTPHHITVEYIHEHTPSSNRETTIDLTDLAHSPLLSLTKALSLPRFFLNSSVFPLYFASSPITISFGFHTHPYSL